MPDPLRKRKRESGNESEKEKRVIDTFVKANTRFTNTQFSISGQFTCVGGGR